MRVILITGVSSGFGRAMAKEFSTRGDAVYGVSRRVPGEDVMACLAGHIQGDLCQPDTAERAVAQVLEKAGRIDVLINNAGSGIGGALEETTDEELSGLFQINFFAMTRLCRAVLPVMRKQKSGRIVNFSSLGGLAGPALSGRVQRYQVRRGGLHGGPVQRGPALWYPCFHAGAGRFCHGFTGSRVMALSEDSPYTPYHKKALKRIEADETGGSKPEVLVKTVAKILEKRNPKLRYGAGNPFECVLVKGRHVMGDKLFLFLLGKYYGTR